MTKTGLLFGALRGNAAFSTLTALPLLVWPHQVGILLGFEKAWVYQLVGAALVVFAIDLISQTKVRQVSGLRALCTCAADLGWVLGTIVILTFWGDAFSAAGRTILIGVACMVLLFATLQWNGLGRIYSHQDLRAWATYCVHFDIDAPREAVWSVISDLAAIERYSSGLAESKIIAGELGEVGCVRQCRDHSNKVWREEVTEFVEYSHYLLRFRHEDVDFPFPVARMEGAWRLFSKDSQGTRVEVSWDVLPKWWLPKQVLMPLLVFQNGRMLPVMAAKMAMAAEGKPFDLSSGAERIKGLQLGVC